MGNLQAQDMAASDVHIEVQLEWHLRSNHYPPLPLSLVATSIAAIDAYNEGDTDAPITLPEGITFRDGPTAPAFEIIEAHHLSAWIDQEEF